MGVVLHVTSLKAGRGKEKIFKVKHRRHRDQLYGHYSHRGHLHGVKREETCGSDRIERRIQKRGDFSSSSSSYGLSTPFQAAGPKKKGEGKTFDGSEGVCSIGQGGGEKGRNERGGAGADLRRIVSFLAWGDLASN